MTTVPRIDGEAIREQRAIARFLLIGDGLVAIVAMLGMVAAPVALVVVLAGLSMAIG
jgi:hypothetical protein